MVIEPLRNANAAAKCLLKNPQRVKKSTEKVGPFEALVNLRLRRWDTSSGASVLLRYAPRTRGVYKLATYNSPYVVCIYRYKSKYRRAEGGDSPHEPGGGEDQPGPPEFFPPISGSEGGGVRKSPPEHSGAGEIL